MVDPVDSKPERLVFNRTVTLRDGWAKAREASAMGAGTEAGTGTGTGAGPESRTEAGESERRAPSPAPPPRAARPEDAEAGAIFDELVSEYGLPEAEASIMAQDAELLALFRTASEHTGDSRVLAKWVVNEVPRVREDRPVADLPFGGAELGRLVELVSSGAVSGRAAKEVLSVIASKGGDPDAVIDERGLGQVSDASALEPVVADVMERNPDKVEAYRNGKTGLLGFFVGQVMSETKGAADPELTQRMLRDTLDGS